MSVIDITSESLPSFSGSVALLTGASSGIGLATAAKLVSLSCSVLICDLQPPPPSVLSTHLLRYHKTDVSCYASVLSAYDACYTIFGQYPNLIFANAGIGEQGDVVVGVSDENIRQEPNLKVIDVNLRGVVNTVRLGWWGIKKNKREGSIVMTASVAGYLGQPKMVNQPAVGLYNATKHAVVGLLRALRYQAPADKISISLIAPAVTSTPLMAPRREEYQAFAAELVSQGVAMQSADQVAHAVVWLFAQKEKANGLGICVQGGEVADWERSIARTRKLWMGSRMSQLYKGISIPEQKL